MSLSTTLNGRCTSLDKELSPEEAMTVADLSKVHTQDLIKKYYYIQKNLTLIIK